MGNTCSNTTDDGIKKANLPNHKRKGPTMVSFDFDSTRGQMESLQALSSPRQSMTTEEGKVGPERKQLKKMAYRA